MLSIIIPTLNEAGFIGRLISQIEAQQTSAEVIVVDGGSTDQTVAEVRSLLNVKFFESEPGRAAQMNLGAKNANGDVLLFLHADSQVDKLLLSGLENALTNGDANAGSFAMQFEESNTWLKLYARFTLHNTRLLTFGDQGLFVKAALFHEIGGFKDIPFLEDVEIQNRLRKSGKFIKLKTPITTSARRFQEKGMVRQQLKNILLVMLFWMGASPHWLGKFYVLMVMTQYFDIH